MPNTNFQTIHQMGGAINRFVKQATGRDAVQNIDMEHITVAQNHYYEDVDISGRVVSFNAGAAGIPLEKCLVQIEPVQEGEGDPSPDNVRPITGWTGAKVTRTGKNLLPIGSVTLPSENNWINNYIPDTPFPAGTYTLSVKVSVTGGMTFNVYDKDGNRLDNKSFAVTASQRTIVTVTASEPICKILGYYNRAGTVSDIQLELGSTATAYEPYQGETYDITFPSEAGTVYGGTLDVTTGVLTVDRAIIASYNGETLPGEWISDRDVYASGATPTTGAQVVYELATPVTYTLTASEIRTLLGQNNIWADTGDIEVKFKKIKEFF